MSLSPGTRLGPYEILGAIGAGGMGEVYRGRDTRLGREVAVKILPAEVADDPSRRQRFELEARAVAALNHPNNWPPDGQVVALGLRMRSKMWEFQPNAERR